MTAPKRGELTHVQKASLLGCSKAAFGMWKPRKVVVAALVRKGYAVELRSGAIALTEAGKRYAETGEQTP